MQMPTQVSFGSGRLFLGWFDPHEVISCQRRSRGKGRQPRPDKDYEVTSNVMVRDGCTVIIGRLMREELKSGGNQIPLHKSPLCRDAFRNQDDTTERHEILV